MGEEVGEDAKVREEIVPRDVQREIDSAERRKESRWREREKKRGAEEKSKAKPVGLVKPEKHGEAKRGARLKGECEMCGREGPVLQIDEGDYCDDCVGKVSSWLR